MKRIFTILFLCFVITPVFAQYSNPLEGSWGLVSFKYTLPDTVLIGNANTFNSIQIFSKTYFSYVGRTTQDNAFKRAGGGRYKLSGDTLTLLIDYSSIPNMLGKAFKFKCTFDGNKWYHSGQINDIYVEELWQKLE